MTKFVFLRGYYCCPAARKPEDAAQDGVPGFVEGQPPLLLYLIGVDAYFGHWLRRAGPITRD